MRRPKTCETCKHYKEDMLDGPAICQLLKLIKWPMNHCNNRKKNTEYKH